MIDASMALGLAGISFMLTVIWGSPLIRVLRHFKIGDKIRVESPERHFTKMGTPTMGGVLIVLPVILITGLLNATRLLGLPAVGRSVFLPLIVMIAYAALGVIDDWEKLRGRRRKGEGMRGRTKFLVQVLFALVAALGLYYVLDVPNLYLPGVKGEIEMAGYIYVPIAIFVIVATTNAFNLTDGMDGLAGLISVTAFTAYGAIALIQGQIFLARFSFTVVGALFGFLWFNVYPADLFMGDTGSLSIGATLAVIALMTGQWGLLPIVAIIPVSEVLSDLLQVGYFKLTGGRRIFKMAPFHYHFELLGWSEPQVVQRFWLISLLFAIFGIALAVV
ncbi:MAG: phospho-N-acetylmuramoyl-pentapeptide-transferase [Anaerolineales bacterium]|jgi:phospho-N-acetylmuramoyl-pentapeptide-transferase|nr:phospho-N-acetylmuramoyl-pentapeptide-transferase [Anaerolineales bacterium]